MSISKPAHWRSWKCQLCPTVFERTCGRHIFCNPCAADRKREYDKKERHGAREYHKAYYEAHKRQIIARAKKRYQENKKKGLILTCEQCGVICPRDTGSQRFCKPCAKERQLERTREWRRTNPVRARSYTKIWSEKNPEAKRAKDRTWRAKNKEKIRQSYIKRGDSRRAYARKWREENPERAKIKNQRWKKANPDRVRISSTMASKRHRKNLSGCYVRALIAGQLPIQVSEISPDIVELKTLQLRIVRAVREGIEKQNQNA